MPIYLRITFNGKNCEFATGRGIEPELWDADRRKARGTKEDARQLNDHLDTICLKIKQIQTRMIEA